MSFLSSPRQYGIASHPSRRTILGLSMKARTSLLLLVLAAGISLLHAGGFRTEQSYTAVGYC